MPVSPPRLLRLSLLVALSCTARTGLAPESSKAACDPAKDRAAIRAMAGAFKVSFAFDETVALSPGYALRAPYRAEAMEVVEVLEETENTLVLQHVLLITSEGKRAPMKHWRQDWTFEDPSLRVFRGNSTWEQTETSPSERRCAWSQAVFEVDDGPRYEALGRWVHEPGISTWTSAPTFRPLPRREYTQRSDYDVLQAINRHTLTPNGWVHEQDNTKLILKEGRALAREHGVNRYDRASLPEAALAHQYLVDTGPFWKAVRAAWEQQWTGHAQQSVRAEVDGKRLYEHLFPLAESSKTLSAPEQRQKAEQFVSQYVSPLPLTAPKAQR